MMNYTEIKLEIDAMKEYIDTELCKKCEEMRNRLEQLKIKLIETSDENGDA